MKLYLVRHGTSTGNTGGTLMGQSDHPLTEEGEAQARAVAARLAPLGPMRVYCSDLPRARATAQRIARVWALRHGGGLLDAASDVGPRVHADPRLREIDLGEYEGRTWNDFIADTQLGAALEADPYDTVLPGGESLAHLVERVLAAVDEIVEEAEAGDGARAVLVSHDGPIRAILNHHLEVPPEKWWTLTTTHGGLSLVEWSDGWVNVRFVNDTSHLGVSVAGSGGWPP